MKVKTFANFPVTTKVMISVSTVLLFILLGSSIFLTSYFKKKMAYTCLDSVQSLFSSFQEGVKGSLERGQMNNFQKLLLQQKKIKNILAVSLYDRAGNINLSSRENVKGSERIPERLQRRMESQDGLIMDYQGNTLQVVAAQRVVNDCIRCHPSWESGSLGGSLSLLYDLTELNNSIARFEIFILTGSIVVLLFTCCIIFFVMQKIVSSPINSLTVDLTTSAATVFENARKVLASSQSFASNAQQQGVFLAETNRSVQEISSMTNQNSLSAANASAQMTDANRFMTEANQAMQKLTHAMSQIATANEETSKIIKTIDGIAFQTNLLALNAAVEAARAGEAGIGFAVVAEEVRNLALRCTEAAKSISSLLNETKQRVENGVALVSETDNSFKDAFEKNMKTADMLYEITTASKNQTAGIGEVTTAMHELDNVTQQNAADADQTAQVADDMEKEAEQLSKYVNALVNLVKGKQV